jgi:hypothetical protein
MNNLVSICFVLGVVGCAGSGDLSVEVVPHDHFDGPAQEAATERPDAGPDGTTVILDQLDQALTGVVGLNPNPLTFWWYGAENVRSLPTLECALGRIRAATCLPVDVSLDAHHWFRFVEPEAIAGYAGYTSGTWASTRIRVTTASDAAYACDVLVHEIGQHVLRRRNDHVGPATTRTLTESLVTDICSRHDCECFQPE